jgi:broad specificity phosphatase PhoE
VTLYALPHAFKGSSEMSSQVTSNVASTVHVVRHGEVENPQKILYGRLPGWRLSTRGQQMAEAVGEWSTALDLGALHVSPLQRAQETALPISRAHNLAITTDDRLIEAANVFEGQKFSVGDGALRHPRAWLHLWNPWKPSWGEPYVEQVSRMLAAIFAAKKAAKGKDAICVSHQLPIWILRSAVEGRHMIHDPRKRECSLASVTSFHFDSEGMISGLSYSEPARHLLPPKK